MKKIVATKQMLVEALLTEPLMNFKHGTWALDYRGTTTSDNESCTVCAVGSFIRSKVAKDHRVSTIARISTMATSKDSIANKYSIEEAEHASLKMIEDGHVLNAVSVMFETECHLVWQEGMNAKDPGRLPCRMLYIIERVVAFVERHVPESFEFCVEDDILDRLRDDLTVV